MRHHNLISTEDTVLVFIDCLDKAIANGAPFDMRAIADNWVELATSAREWRVPIIATMMQQAELNGASTLVDQIPSIEAIERIGVNPWDHEPFAEAIAATSRRRLVLAGSFTEGAITFAALSALHEGYDTYVAHDASIGATTSDHETAVARMRQAGAVPVTCRQLLLEWGRNIS